MKRNVSTMRWLLSLAVLAGLCFNAAGQSLTRVDAAPVATATVHPREISNIVAPNVIEPLLAADELNIVISEFRFLGPEGGNDEFIELFNPSGIPINIGGWEVWGSNNAGGTGTTPRAALNNVTLLPGQHYLLVKDNASAGLLALADETYTSGITDDGGIALTLADGTTIIDAVGLSSGSAYKEGTVLTPLSGTAEQSYERKTSGNVTNCNDTNNNVGDFVRNSTSSNPQNFTSSPLACLTVTNVSSTNGIYAPGNTINIYVSFSAPVNVIGNPTLLLETGSFDGTATFSDGSGSNSLKFIYIVASGDSSVDLDYTSAYSLSLNGGSITGAVGDATLILPKPGTTGSLGANNVIIIDNGLNPTTLSIRRQNPALPLTNSNALTFRVTFSEAVTGVDTNDFVVNSTPATTASVTGVTGSGSVYDITISGGDLAVFNGVVGLNFVPVPSIQDSAGHLLPGTSPVANETYEIDHVVPTVTINQANGQADPATTLPIQFTVVFSKAIDVSTFAASDITQNGNAPFLSWIIIDSGNHKTFTLAATAMGNGTIIPTIAANKVKDAAGNFNTVSTFSDNSVTISDTVAPTVTINRANGQAGTTTVLPIRFSVIFSEPINPSVFTTSDITQNGTATGITWNISDSGDHTSFTVSATTAGHGTLKPSILANRVTDMVGNNNAASTTTDVPDNTVIYNAPPTSTKAPLKTVVITEIGWMGTSSSTTTDEWIELYNNTTAPVSLEGWHLRSYQYNATTKTFVLNLDIALSGTISVNSGSGDANDTSGFFLLERREQAVNDITGDLIYGGTKYLSNSGEILLLCSTFNIDANNCSINTKNQVVDFVNASLTTAGSVNPWPAGSSSTYGSMERKNLYSDEDTTWFTHTGANPHWGRDANNNAIKGTPKHANWAYNVTSTPRATVTSTTTRTPQAIPGPILVLNEFLARAGTDWNNDGRVDVGDEFIEVINAGTVNVSLGGYKLDDYELDADGKLISNGFTLPSQTLKPGEKMVYYGSQTGILLDDSGDTVRLLRSTTLVDAVSYPVVKTLDSSVCRYTDGYGTWIMGCFPTPGRPNELMGDRQPTASDGPVTACYLPDSTPEEFVIAECGESGLGIWNPSYWDSLPGEGDEVWQPEERDKAPVIYQ
jgi:hypothetical protein